MKRISLKKFQKKYKPTLPPTAQSNEYGGLAWNIHYHEEYIRNKMSSYVWTIVKDPDLGIIGIPHKDITNSLGFFIATEARKVEGYEYIKL